MTSWSVGQMLYHQATGDLVTDPREGPGGGGAGPSLFLDQTEARRSEKIFFQDRLPPSYLRVWIITPPPPPQTLRS